MSEELDELFGEGTGTPKPRTGWAIFLLACGLILAFFGLACTSAPGGLIVLWAWSVIDKEVDRVESGYLPVDTLPQIRALQRLSQIALGLVIILFIIQVILLCMGFYEHVFAQLGYTIIPLLRSLLGTG
ncbi:MAG: hypothetical protein HN348_32985 [Proteobacteria bacterium]|jgi:hypothetical protein|nr:hypothetical protein [Pseudomonadota bacterium]